MSWQLAYSGYHAPDRSADPPSDQSDGYRDVREPGDVHHLNAAQAGVVDLVARPTLTDLLECDATLEASERGAEARVDAVPEPDRQRQRPADVEPVRVRIRPLVPACRPGDQEHRLVRVDRHAVPLRRLRREPALVLRRCPVAEDLLDTQAQGVGIR